MLLDLTNLTRLFNNFRKAMLKDNIGGTDLFLSQAVYLELEQVLDFFIIRADLKKKCSHCPHILLPMMLMFIFK